MGKLYTDFISNYTTTTTTSASASASASASILSETYDRDNLNFQPVYVRMYAWSRAGCNLQVYVL